MSTIYQLMTKIVDTIYPQSYILTLIIPVLSDAYNIIADTDLEANRHNTCEQPSVAEQAIIEVQNDQLNNLTVHVNHCCLQPAEDELLNAALYTDSKINLQASLAVRPPRKIDQAVSSIGLTAATNSDTNNAYNELSEDIELEHVTSDAIPVDQVYQDPDNLVGDEEMSTVMVSIRSPVVIAVVAVSVLLVIATPLTLNHFYRPTSDVLDTKATGWSSNHSGLVETFSKLFKISTDNFV
jgi:hypothetical protein